MANEDAQVEHDGTRIEGENVGVLHQGKAASAETLDQRGREHLETLIKCCLEGLEARGLLLLRVGVVAVEEEEDLPGGLLRPTERTKLLAQGLEVVEFTARLALEEIQVDIAVVVGELALLAVTNETRHGAEQPDEDAPIVVRQEGDGVVHEASANGEIDAEEPDIASKTIEYAAPARLLARHTRQLAIGTIVEVGPDEQEYSADVHPQVFKIETDGRGNTQEDAENRHNVGMHAQLVKEARPKIAQRTCEIDVQPLFGILGLER